MAVKFRTIVFLLTAAFWLTSCSVNNRDNDVEQIFSLDGKVELLFFFKKDIPQETRDSFFETTLNQPHPGGG